MNVPVLFKNIGRMVSENSPAILTAAAAVGTVTTTVLAVRATTNAIRYIDRVESVHGTPSLKRTLFESRIKLVWKHYVPVMTMGGVTVSCIIGANTISARRSAALLTAYSLSEATFREYKTKVVETLGASKDQKVIDEIAQDRVDKNPIGNNEVLITSGGDVLCYDELSGRYFESSVETIRKAQNDINAEIINNMYASQNEFYSQIGLPPITMGDELGWRSDHLMEIKFTTVLSEDNKPCLAMNYDQFPIKSYYKVN